MKWLYRIFSLMRGCRHKWVIIQQVDVYESDYASKPCERKYIMKCAKCGDMKKRTM